MSGTSIDGIDAALVSFESENRLQVIDTQFTEFSPKMRKEIDQTAQNNTALKRNEDSYLHQELAPIYASAVERLISKSGLKRSNISGIANHGQTVKHEPMAKPPYSLQLGDGQTIADLTGITTYTQFRQADLQAGGQGAPLMPAFHQALFGSNNLNANVHIVNIGGIANITHLSETITGFDTGPGNVLLDQWIEQHKAKAYDKNGDWAASGCVDANLLSNLLSDDYFSLNHPKSTGTDYFNLAWLEKRYQRLTTLKPNDVQASLTELTTRSICNELIKLSDSRQETKVYICGGGARNKLIMQKMTQHLTEQLSEDVTVEPSDALGIPSDWVEAVGFAWLGYCCANSITSNLPSVTGANSKVVLGQCYQPRNQESADTT